MPQKFDGGLTCTGSEASLLRSSPAGKSENSNSSLEDSKQGSIRFGGLVDFGNQRAHNYAVLSFIFSRPSSLQVLY